MNPATLTVKTGRGVDRVIVDFDRGREETAFALLRDALPAVQELDRCVRNSICSCESHRATRRAR